MDKDKIPKKYIPKRLSLFEKVSIFHHTCNKSEWRFPEITMYPQGGLSSSFDTSVVFFVNMKSKLKY